MQEIVLTYLKSPPAMSWPQGFALTWK